ncbi:hypothetical protein [Streptosporangium carneum]|uniref:Uncharacterized protein n=1 Tax=Streptosporangium carneum TaxID=47481 RepID=A0A9W6IA74_9ACTN|nr:hypothetical protein [Streptosporangium carneum]GLK14463.1 hypothetical protein GCM10017600_78750 [Streptosporangium carneum]
MLSQREREFLQASVDAEAHEQEVERRRTRRLRGLVVLLGVLLLAAGVATGYALRARGAAAEQRDVGSSRRAADQAVSLRAANPPPAGSLGQAAYRLGAAAEARDTTAGHYR